MYVYRCHFITVHTSSFQVVVFITLSEQCSLMLVFMRPSQLKVVLQKYCKQSMELWDRSWMSDTSEQWTSALCRAKYQISSWQQKFCKITFFLVRFPSQLFLFISWDSGNPNSAQIPKAQWEGNSKNSNWKRKENNFSRNKPC